MLENTIYFSSPGQCEEVLAPRGGLLCALEEAFGVQVAARDYWWKLKALELESALHAEKFLHLLRDLRNRGADLRGPARFYILRTFLAGKKATLRAMAVSALLKGESAQIDLPGNKRSRPREALQALDRVDGIAWVPLTEDDVVRHALVRCIIRAYRDLQEPAAT